MEEKISVERAVMNDYWALRKKFYQPENDEKYWSDLIDAVNELSRKYNCDYLDKLLLVCIDDLEIRFRQDNLGKDERITFVPKEGLDWVYSMLKRRREEKKTA